MHKLSQQQRHDIMASIHAKGTKPELLVRRWLWNHGYRYRLNVKSVPGSPDIVMRKYRTAIFVNGCFWHGHEGCNKYSSPKTNTDFWIAKVTRNRERDQRNYKDLHDAGWHVIVIWECQLKKSNIEATMHGVEHVLSRNLLVTYKNH